MVRILQNPKTTTARTSQVERQTLTLRMSNRRYARATNAFSKKLVNHAHAFNYMVCNVVRPRLGLQSPRRNPVTAAGITDRPGPTPNVIHLVDSN